MSRLHIIFDPHDKVEVPSVEWQRAAKCRIALIPLTEAQTRDNIHKMIDWLLDGENESTGL